MQQCWCSPGVLEALAVCPLSARMTPASVQREHRAAAQPTGKRKDSSAAVHAPHSLNGARKTCSSAVIIIACVLVTAVTANKVRSCTSQLARSITTKLARSITSQLARSISSQLARFITRQLARSITSQPNTSSAKQLAQSIGSQLARSIYHCPTSPVYQ